MSSKVPMSMLCNASRVHILVASSDRERKLSARCLVRAKTLSTLELAIAIVLAFFLAMLARYRRRQASPKGITTKARQPTTDQQPLIANHQPPLKQSLQQANQ